MTATRTENAKRIALAPLYLVALLFGMAYMVVTVPLLIVALAVTLLPAEVLWALSPFVGVVSPRRGHWLASFMDPGCDALERCIDVLWRPLEWLGY